MVKKFFFVYMRFSLADKGVHAVLDAEAGLSLICRQKQRCFTGFDIQLSNLDEYSYHLTL
jgi:hypothetical protein